MKWENFIKITGDLPIIDTDLFRAGLRAPLSIKVQISRWQRAGKLIQIRRGLYALASPYRKIDIYLPAVAALVKKPSYISMEKALEYHGVIPEAVPVYTSVTTKRPGKCVSSLGIFDYRHVKKSVFWGYESVTVNKQTAFIALPEKALLDLFYLKNIKVSSEYLEEMRLQSFEKFDVRRLIDYAGKFKKKHIVHAAVAVKKYILLRKSKEKEL